MLLGSKALPCRRFLQTIHGASLAMAKTSPRSKWKPGARRSPGLPQPTSTDCTMFRVNYPLLSRIDLP